MRKLLHRFGIRTLTASIAVGAGLACAGLAAAQEPQSEPAAAQAGEVAASETDSDTAYADSIATELDEFVVEGRTQRVIKNGVEYMPDGKTKKMAHNATSLLEFMQIPQLKIAPVKGTITTRNDEPIDSYIDYVKATEEDLKGLRPEDVMRVEVLDYPDDPRFAGSDHVINYILHKYEWGGYTKLDVNGTALGKDMGSAILYSKFSYRNWTFDANISATLMHENRDSYSRETFKDIFIGNEHIDRIDRITTYPASNCLKTNGESASLRAIWNSGQSFVSHQLFISREESPSTSTKTHEEFSKDILPSTDAINTEYQQSMGIAAAGNYYFQLKRQHSLSAYWLMIYNSNRRNSSYQLGDLTPIINNNRETSYNPFIQMNYLLPLGHNNNLDFLLVSNTQIFNTEYFGSYQNSIQKLRSSQNLLLGKYTHQLTPELNLMARVGISYLYSRLNGNSILNTWNPRAYIVIGYKFNQSNALSMEMAWGNAQPSPQTTNEATVQQDELMWLKGNPHMRNPLMPYAAVKYNYIPTNNFSLIGSLMYDAMLNDPSFDYLSIPGYNGVVKTATDDVKTHNFSLSLTGSLRLLNNSLNLEASLGVKQTEKRGIYTEHLTAPYASASARYFLGNFAFNIFYTSPNTRLYEYIKRSTRSIYGLSCAYSAGNFKGELKFNNWFNSNRCYQTLHTSHYDLSGWTTFWDISRVLMLNLSYTLPYGKKVDRNNELPSGSIQNSAIMK